jgi:hypothetical protein
MILAESLEVPSSYQSQISKIATGIRELGAACIVVDHDDRMVAVRAFCAQYVSLNNLSSILYPKDDKSPERESLETLTDRYFTQAMCERNAYTVEEIVASVLARAEAMLADQEG